MTGITADILGTADIHPQKSLGKPCLFDTHSTALKQAFNLSEYSHILPYQTIDSNLIFHNTDSYGFGIHLPLHTVNHEKTTRLLLNIIETLPAGIHCTVILHKQTFLHTMLDEPFDSASSNDAFSLQHCPSYLFFSTQTSPKTILRYRKQLKLKLDIAKQKYALLGKIDFFALIRTWLTYPNTQQQPPTFVDVNRHALHTLIIPAHTLLTPQTEYLQVDYFDPFNNPCTQDLINCHVVANAPDTGAILALLNPAMNLPCPFWRSVTFRSHTIKNTVTYFHNIVLMTQREKALIDLRQSQALYQAHGYQLKPTKSHQTMCFLSGLPFFITEKHEQYFYDHNLLHSLSTSQTSTKNRPMIYQTNQPGRMPFDENQIPSYDDILPHTQRLSIKKRNKICRTR